MPTCHLLILALLMTLFAVPSLCLPVNLSDLPIECLLDIYDRLDLCDRTNLGQADSLLRGIDKEKRVEHLSRFQTSLEAIAKDIKTPFEVALTADIMSNTPQLFGHWLPNKSSNDPERGEASEALHAFRQAVLSYSPPMTEQVVSIFKMLNYLKLTQDCRVFAGRLPPRFGAESVKELSGDLFFQRRYRTKLSDLCPNN